MANKTHTPTEIKRSNGGDGKTGNGGGKQVVLNLSVFSEPIRTDEGRSQLLQTATFVRAEVRDQIIAKANRTRVQDPLKLRALAVDAAVSTAQKRRLIRIIESAVAAAGGSTLLQSFPNMADAILFEALRGRDPDEIVKIEPEELRAPAEEFVRTHHQELYTDRIRQVLSDVGMEVTDALLGAIYEDLNRRRVPLPIRTREGVLT